MPGEYEDSIVIPASESKSLGWDSQQDSPNKFLGWTERLCLKVSIKEDSRYQPQSTHWGTCTYKNFWTRVCAYTCTGIPQTYVNRKTLFTEPSEKSVVLLKASYLHKFEESVPKRKQLCSSPLQELHSWNDEFFMRILINCDKGYFFEFPKYFS